MVFQETKNYQWYNIMTLMIGFTICISGILVIFNKTSKPHGSPVIEEEEDTRDELDDIDSDTDSDE